MAICTTFSATGMGEGGGWVAYSRFVGNVVGGVIDVVHEESSSLMDASKGNGATWGRAVCFSALSVLSQNGWKFYANCAKFFSL